MELSIHDVAGLFDQLGLPSAPDQVDGFIASHRPLADDIPLPDAPFWSESQSSFLRSEWEKDAAWVEAIDQLNTRLR